MNGRWSQRPWRVWETLDDVRFADEQHRALLPASCVTSRGQRLHFEGNVDEEAIEMSDMPSTFKRDELSTSKMEELSTPSTSKKDPSERSRSPVSSARIEVEGVEKGSLDHLEYSVSIPEGTANVSSPRRCGARPVAGASDAIGIRSDRQRNRARARKEEYNADGATRITKTFSYMIYLIQQLRLLARKLGSRTFLSRMEEAKQS
ncbi:hypothetical protein L596_005436 [Steinernema carpocapsae]|uniref:Uncharacterized protein n=1 Tax=Steinernema carpocapsae TaxID=34508 RepID=A0A4U8UZ95_STECR|nr:hypothetical protein L596_005436 [Steinernema carpocapsae]